MNIASALEDHASKSPERIAIRSEGRSISYGALNRDACQLADALASRGILAGDRIALYLPNCPEFVVAYYAAQKLGAVVVTINAIFKTAEVRYLINDAEPLVVFTTRELSEFVPADCPSPRYRVIIDADPGDLSAGWVRLAQLTAAGSPVFVTSQRKPDDEAALLYSSGTTGSPKGVVLTQHNIDSNIRTSQRCSDYRPGDRVAAFLPLFHVYGQNYIMNAAILGGATIVLFRRYERDTVLAAIGKERITHFFAVPTIYIDLLSTDVTRYDLSSLRYEMSAAATMPEEISRRWTERFGRRVFEGYGLTESSPIACYNDLETHRFGSVGRALPGMEVKIFDEFDVEVPRGAIGEIVIRSPGVMKGYWNKPDDTERALRAGWLHSGDIGRMDEDGYVYIVDRVKDMINVAGFKVWPAELEQHLYKLDGILEVAVYGVPHPRTGEQVAAAIVLADGARLSAEDIIGYCRQNLAAYKVPAIVDITDGLPKSPTGKLLKRVLRERYAAAPKGA